MKWMALWCKLIQFNWPFDKNLSDRTAEIRTTTNGMACRHLGTVQMTADTAVIVAKRILLDQQPLSKLPFEDRPSFAIRPKEFVEMPFRYLLNDCGQPLLPSGMLDLWRRDGF